MFSTRTCYQNVSARCSSAVWLLLALSLTGCATGADGQSSRVDRSESSSAATAESDPQQDIASAVPDTDIFVFRIDPATPNIVVAFDANVTRRIGYDNQPGYIPGTNDFLFSSILDGRQSDVYRYREASKSLTQVTQTDLSEYSPTSLNGDGFSAVVVEADGTQRLWRYSDSGVPDAAYRADVTGIGYHAWLPEDELAVFIVDEPLMHLDVIGVSTDARYTLAVNPGRSLHVRPQSKSLSFVQHRENERSRLMSWDGANITFLVNMPEAVEDMTWLPDGRALTVAEGKLLVWSEGETAWTVAVDLGDVLPGDVTRLAVNSAATRLAVVSSMSAAESP